MLCDSAQVADGKLYILGGGWSVTGPGAMPSAVAMKIDVDWTAAGSPHHWELFLVDEDGHSVLVETPEGERPMEVGGDIRVDRPPNLPEGSPIDVALAVNFGPLPLAAGIALHLAADDRRGEPAGLGAVLLDPAAPAVEDDVE